MVIPVAKGQMQTIKIKLNTPEDVKKFVSVVSKYPFDMDLRCGRFIVDAKSILGIFSLDRSNFIFLDIYSNDAKQLLKQLKEFVQI